MITILLVSGCSALLLTIGLLGLVSQYDGGERRRRREARLVSRLAEQEGLAPYDVRAIVALVADSDSPIRYGDEEEIAPTLLYHRAVHYHRRHTIVARAYAPRRIMMHAVMITFRSTVDLDDLSGTFVEYGRALQQVPGLLAKTWVQDGATFGGFYVFASREATEDYLASAMVADLAANPAFSDFAVRHFVVLEAFTQLTQPTLFAAAV